MTLDPTRAEAIGPPNENCTISIGGDTTGNYIDGRIDEMQFWNTALTQQEINAWMYREIDGTHPKKGNLVNYYKFNQNSGNNVLDHKGAHNGTAVNMTASNWVSSIEILVNGKPETAATAATTKVEDKTVTTITMDDKKVEEKLEREDNKVLF